MDNYLDSYRTVEIDSQTGEWLFIQAGPNGKVDTVANSMNIVPQHVPNKQDLEDYLNDVWGKQANIYFEVEGSSGTINYDLDRSGYLNDLYLYSNGVEKSYDDVDEINKISTLKNIDYDYNLYYVRSVEYPIAIAFIGIGEAFIEDYSNNPIYVSAHEIGHLLGRSGHSESKFDLMYRSAEPSAPCRITRTDWNMVNPLTQE
jgi:hypothetical protein